MDVTSGDTEGFICLAVHRPPSDLLRRQIRSLQTQSERRWRCLIGIDGRDDAAFELVHSLVGDDHRFRVTMFDDNVGFYRNFERILTYAPRSSSWIALADQDDEWLPHKLEALVPILSDHSMAVGGILVAHEGAHEEITRASRRQARMLGNLLDNQVSGSACVFKSELLDLALPFPAQCQASFHDHWLAMCALAVGGVHHVPGAHQLYIQHGGNVIGELGGERLSLRIARLRRSAGSGVVGNVRYLRDHRWAWRVSMARELLERSSELSRQQRLQLEAFARGTLSAQLALCCAKALFQRSAPAGRVLALVLGAAWNSVESSSSHNSGVRPTSVD